MAKRFTDTDKWKMAWFRKLGSEGRDIWNYLHDNCDFAGFFEIDCERVSFELGFPITLERIQSVLNGKFQLIGNDRIFLPAFIEFQYGTLNEEVRPHVAVIKKMKSQRVWEGYAKGYLTHKDKDKEQDKDKDQDQDRKGGVGEKQTQPSPLHLEACKETWKGTLVHFGQDRPLSPREIELILRSITLNGAELTDLALFGARFEQANDGFDPRKHVDITRILLPKEGRSRLEKFAGLGSQAKLSTQRRLADEDEFRQNPDDPNPALVQNDPAEVEKFLKEVRSRISGGAA